MRVKIPDQVLEDIRARLPIEAVIGRAVRLEARGTWRKGLCPFHKETRPSFAVRPASRSFHCFGCGAHGDVIGFVQRVEGISFPEAARRCATEAGLAVDWAAAAPAPWVARPRPVAALVSDDGAEDRTAIAGRLWRAAVPILPGSPQALYLAGRGLWPLPPACHAVLRATTARHVQADATPHPVLIARIDGPDGSARGVHRTWLGQAGARWTKLAGVGDPRRSLGPLKGNAIRLFPVAEVLGVAEGIETALAATALSGLPVWSCLNATALAAVELPLDVRRLVVFADRDRPRLRAEGHQGQDMPDGAGIHFARQLAGRATAQGIAVEIRAPAQLGDYADLLQQQAEVAA